MLGKILRGTCNSLYLIFLIVESVSFVLLLDVQGVSKKPLPLEIHHCSNLNA